MILRRWVQHCLYSLISAIAFFSAPALADTYRIIDGAEEALQLRVDLIQQARSEILLSYYIVGKDLTTLQLLSLLQDAKNRGVTIKVLVDGLNNGVSRAITTYLDAAGIEFREYNQPDLDGAGSVSRRMHDKLFIVDGRRLVMGGRNIKDSYYGLDQHTFKDRDVYIEAPVISSVREYFLARWTSKKVERIRKVKKDRKLSKAAEILQRARLSLAQHPYVKLDTGTSWALPQSSLPVRFAHDSVPGYSDGSAFPNVVGHMLALIDSAQKTLFIENPYVIPTRNLRAALERALGRGVKIRILTNSLLSTDVDGPQSAYHNDKRDLIRKGVEIWEYNVAGVTLHSKSAVVDGKIAAIGSFNLDPRSERLNTEIMAFVEDPETARRLEESMQQTLLHSVRIGEDGIPIGHDRQLIGVPLVRQINFRVWQHTLAWVLRTQL